MFTFLTGRCYKTCGSTDKISMLIFAAIALTTLAVLHISIFVINWKDRNFQHSICPSLVANQNTGLIPNNLGSKKDKCVLISTFLLTFQCVAIIYFLEAFGESNPYSVRMMAVFMAGFAVPSIFALSKPNIRAFIFKTFKEANIYNWFLLKSPNAIYPQSL